MKYTFRHKMKCTSQHAIDCRTGGGAHLAQFRPIRAATICCIARGLLAPSGTRQLFRRRCGAPAQSDASGIAPRALIVGLPNSGEPPHMRSSNFSTFRAYAVESPDPTRIVVVFTDTGTPHDVVATATWRHRRKKR